MVVRWLTLLLHSKKVPSPFSVHTERPRPDGGVELRTFLLRPNTANHRAAHTDDYTTQKFTHTHHTYSNALPHDAGLLHASRPAELLHVFAEVTLSALRPQTRLAFPTACPSPPGSRCTPAGRQLDR